MKKKVLFTFLGTTDYKKATYRMDNKTCDSCYVAFAIATITGAQMVKVFTTDEAKKMNGPAIQGLFEGTKIDCDLIDIPSGSGENEQWQLFETMLQEMRDMNCEVIVDITSGFRVLSFFVSAVISMLRATDQGSHHLRLLYGEFKGEGKEAPIWDLTLFVELQDWVQALRVFLRTGHAESLNALTGSYDRRLRREHFAGGGNQNDKPKTENLVKALRDFANDLSTVRVAAMLIGDQTKDVPSSSKLVLAAIKECREDIQLLMPPLGGILDELTKMLTPLPTKTLSGLPGHGPLLALANIYKEFGRYAEAATVVREGYICWGASREACDVGSESYNQDARGKAEAMWRTQDQDLSSSVTDVRNDIDHGGFRACPLSSTKMKKRVHDLVQNFSELQDVEGEQPVHGKFYFVSRHSGAVEWAKEEGFRIDVELDHLDMAIIQQGDTVIGSLPVNLVAEVCQKGARYLHLSLRLTAELRGKELSPADMRACDAHLEAYQVRRV